MKARTARRLRGVTRASMPWRAGCAGKIRFASTSLAEAWRHDKHPADKSMGVYLCRYCDGVHLGHLVSP